MWNNLSLLTLAIAAASLFLLYLLSRILRRLLVALRPGTPHVEIVAPTDAPPPASPELHQSLLNLGFRHVGVSWTKTALLQAYSWYYVDPTHHIFAEMIALPRRTPAALVAFNTWFSDQAIIYTSYPLGDHLTTADLQVTYSSRNLEAALSYHQQQVAAWRKLHGEPVERRGLDDMEYYDRLYREKYHMRHLRNSALRSGLLVLVLSLMLITNLAVMLETIYNQPIYVGVHNGTLDPSLFLNSGLINATAPYMLHWLIGFIIISRLSSWKAPSIEATQT